MACPYFYPTERLGTTLWPHPSRLPLGGGFRGLCHARPGEHFSPDESRLRDCCNLGYAGAQCDRFPGGAPADAVRFSLAGEDNGIITIYYAREKGHLPVEHGALQYDTHSRIMVGPPHDPFLRRQMEAYAESYLLSRPRRPA